jgi:AraC family transcriptional regulator
MILQQFPDLAWLKSQIAQRFKNRIGYGGIPLEQEGFPSVIINTQVQKAWRPDVTGPISLFLNLQGSSRCTVDNRSVMVSPDYYFLSNRFQPYTLEIESRQPVETFNIHIGEAFSEGVFSALLTPADVILNNGVQQKAVTVAFHNQLYRKDESFNRIIHNIKQTQSLQHFNKLRFEEAMTSLVVYLLQQHRHLLKKIAQMPALKASTRQELYKRLSFSLDWLHTQEGSEIDLDSMAAAACLSKYHFLRLFKQAYGLSPYQYWQNLRLEKGEHLLRHTQLPVNQIALDLGFENAASFSRLFRQRKKLYPTQFRTVAN